MRALLLAASLFVSGCYQSHELGGGAPDTGPTDLCARTGGHTDSGCCDWHCGDRCLLRCVRDVCICPSATQVWDPARGCVASSMCGVHGG